MRIGPTGDRLNVSLNEIQAATRTMTGKLDVTLAALEQAAEDIQLLARDTRAQGSPVAKSLRGAGSSARAAFDSRSPLLLTILKKY
jgi:hypothetical protein